MRFTNPLTRISVFISKNATNKHEYIPRFTCLYVSQKSKRPKIKLAPKLTEGVILSVINSFFFLLIKGGAPTARNAAAAAGFPELHSARNHICPDSGTSCPALHFGTEDSYWIVRRTAAAIPGHAGVLAAASLMITSHECPATLDGKRFLREREERVIYISSADGTRYREMEDKLNP